MPSSKATERFETPPGQQAQFDWSPYTVELGGELTRVIVFGMTLGYSRRKHYTASLDETQASILEQVADLVGPDGAFTTFAYLHGMALKAARRFRAALHETFE